MFYDGWFAKYDDYYYYPKEVLKAIAFAESSFNSCADNGIRYGLMQTTITADLANPDLAIYHGAEILKEKREAFPSGAGYRYRLYGSYCGDSPFYTVGVRKNLIKYYNFGGVYEKYEKIFNFFICFYYIYGIWLYRSKKI